MGSGARHGISDAAIYDRIARIRADLLEVISQVEDAYADSSTTSAMAIQDELLMVANRLGRVAAALHHRDRDDAVAPPGGEG